MRLNTSLIGALVALTALAACGGGPTFMRDGGGGVLNGGARADRLPNRPAPFTTTVSRGEVVVDGPVGFCVDTGATKDSAENAFVVMGNCASLSSASISESSRFKALLTASLAVSADGNTAALDGEALSAFFKSDAGLASLSRQDASGPVNLIETFFQDDVFYAYADDGGERAKNLDQSYWRAILVIKGRLTSLTVQDFASQKMSDSDSLNLMREFVATMRTANDGQARPDFTPVAAANPVKTTPKPKRGLVGVGLLRRILQ